MPRKQRGKKIKIDWGCSEPYSVSIAEFHRAVASGWLIPAGENRAVLPPGVIGRLRDGALWLLNEVKQTTYWIYTSWLAVDRVSPIIQGPYFQRTLEREHCGPRVVRQESKEPWWKRADWKASGVR